MRDGTGIREQTSPSRQRGEAHIRRNASYPKAQIKRSRARVENERRIQQVGFVEQIAALDHVQKCHEQQEGNSQSHHYDQRCTRRRWLRFDSCYSCHRRILQPDFIFRRVK